MPKRKPKIVQMDPDTATYFSVRGDAPMTEADKADFEAYRRNVDNAKDKEGKAQEDRDEQSRHGPRAWKG